MEWTYFQLPKRSRNTIKVAKTKRNSETVNMQISQSNGSSIGQKSEKKNNIFFVFTWFIATFSFKMVSIKSQQASLIRHLTFIKPKKALFDLKLLISCWQFQCAGLLRSSKVVHIDGKNVALFTQDLVYKGMS